MTSLACLLPAAPVASGTSSFAHHPSLIKTYSTSQVSDHKLYHSVYSENPEAFTMSVLRSTRYNPNSVYSARAPRDDTWDARPSVESLRDEGYGQGQHPNQQHGYYDQQQQQQHDGYGADDQRRYEDAYNEGSQAYPNTYEGYGHPQQGYGYDQHDGYGHAHQHQGSYGYGEAPAYEPQHPQGAVARDAGDTPVLNQYSDGQGTGWNAGHGDVRRPEDMQGHPGECRLLPSWRYS